jgi:hypothetical protein
VALFRARSDFICRLLRTGPISPAGTTSVDQTGRRQRPSRRPCCGRAAETKALAAAVKVFGGRLSFLLWRCRCRAPCRVRQRKRNCCTRRCRKQVPAELRCRFTAVRPHAGSDACRVLVQRERPRQGPLGPVQKRSSPNWPRGFGVLPALPPPIHPWGIVMETLEQVILQSRVVA